MKLTRSIFACLFCAIASAGAPWPGDAPPATRPASPVVGTEVDELVKLAKPPARFADHKPRFSIEKQVVEFRSPSGPEPKTMWAIKDGDKYVAVYSDRPQIDLITPDPAAAPAKIAWPVRYHNGTYLNTRITTIAYVDKWAVTGDTAGVGFISTPDAVTVTEWQRWTMAGKYARDGQTIAHHTLRLDPILGYVIDVDGTMEFTAPPVNWTRKPLATVEVTNLLASRMSDIWPGESRYDTTIYSQQGLGTLEFRGWHSNLAAADLSDFRTNMALRPTGIVGFIGSDGWSPVTARTDESPFSLATCNVWQDQHNHVKLATVADKDGIYRTRYRYRFAFMPPEVTKVALERTKIDNFGGMRAVMLRFGQLEDFEDQPLPLTVKYRAGYSTSYGPKSAISTEFARSGKRSMVMGGVAKEGVRKGFNGFIFTPQFNLKASTTYRLECWVKIVGDDTEAFIAADLYQESPHIADRFKVQQTNTAKSSPDWQKLELEFTTPDWDPFVDLRLLVAGAGKAYFDDFQFVPVAAPATRPALTQP